MSSKLDRYKENIVKFIVKIKCKRKEIFNKNYL